ncbi:competence/damage-inducible protein CinA [Desulfotomaculum nigrificans CO-1-SRB]|uniref:Putative competence-damage inducible protein n=1 Tax=Desulfotomaculum nigrificans (strain DSM 14880 / VKM B-2319 / CO-1-SRB) TaxID=868595 RepID=F6B5Z1_DESCC|nr:competence/damage-inducible protein A [Desulfotomaculum nigrificans]AEF94310.1 competence/damage-inducible protein CinA [Desulfotomaculum nigrificans CO-1-SRB]
MITLQAEIIFTGTELLVGEVLNSHAQYLGRRLTEMGIEVIQHSTVGDYWGRMGLVLLQALERADIIFITGGLGPTIDDLTKETVAEVLELDMKLDESSLEAIKEFFAKRGMEMPANNIKQAYFPEGAKILPNPRGTAPGAIVEVDKKAIIILPGPPWELETMFEASVVPYLNSLPHRGVLSTSKIFKLTGITESTVQEMIEDLCGKSNPEIAFLVQPGVVEVRITGQGKTLEEANALVQQLSDQVRRRLFQYIFAEDREKIEQVVGQLLIDAGLTLAVAESCTGGLIEARLSDIPGASRYLVGGIIAYSNQVKEKILGVPAETLAQYGAVSRQTAIAMAEGVRRELGSNIGLAVTGVAGPTSSEGKPVGLVYIALSSPTGTCFREYRFPGERKAIRNGTVNAALKMAKHFLQGK